MAFYSDFKELTVAVTAVRLLPPYYPLIPRHVYPWAEASGIFWRAGQLESQAGVWCQFDPDSLFDRGPVTRLIITVARLPQSQARSNYLWTQLAGSIFKALIRRSEPGPVCNATQPFNTATYKWAASGEKKFITSSASHNSLCALTCHRKA